MKRIYKAIIAFYTTFYILILFSLIYLHIKYPGYYVHYKFLNIYYNNWLTYVVISLVYIIAIIEAVVGVKMINIILKKLHKHSWEPTGVPYEMECSKCGIKESLFS